MIYQPHPLDPATEQRIERICQRDRARRGADLEPTTIVRKACPDELRSDQPVSGLALLWSQGRPRPVDSANSATRRMRPLTAAMIETWRHVQQHFDRTGQPPSVETLRQMAGGLAKNAIVKRLDRLALAGMVARDPVSRRLQLLERVPDGEGEAGQNAA